MSDTISRRQAIEALRRNQEAYLHDNYFDKIVETDIETLTDLPSAQPERTWYPATEPPNHHNDVIVRGIEAIGNVTVHKIMQWDVDTWRPTDYAPSITWKEWSEI